MGRWVSSLLPRWYTDLPRFGVGSVVFRLPSNFSPDETMVVAPAAADAGAGVRGSSCRERLARHDLPGSATTSPPGTAGTPANLPSPVSCFRPQSAPRPLHYAIRGSRRAHLQSVVHSAREPQAVTRLRRLQRPGDGTSRERSAIAGSERVAASLSRSCGRCL